MSLSIILLFATTAFALIATPGPTVLLALSNGMNYGPLFFSAFLPQFVDPASPQLPQFAALDLVFACLDCVVTLCYAAAGERTQGLLRNAAAFQ